MEFFSFTIVAAALIASFALNYSFAPNHTPFSFQSITPGAIAAIVFWLIVSGSFQLYLHFFDSHAKTYGSIGAINVLLLWLCLTALAILLGGIVNAVADELSAANKNKISK